MSFQAYLDNIQLKTGLLPRDFQRLAEEKGFATDGKLLPRTKAGDVIAWLGSEYDLGRGHAMAIYALLNGSKTA